MLQVRMRMLTSTVTVRPEHTHMRALTLAGSCMMRWRYRRRNTDARNLSSALHWLPLLPAGAGALVGFRSRAMASCDSIVGTDAAHDRCGSMRAAKPPE